MKKKIVMGLFYIAVAIWFVTVCFIDILPHTITVPVISVCLLYMAIVGYVNNWFEPEESFCE